MSNFEDPPKATPASLESDAEAPVSSEMMSGWQMIDRLFRRRPGLMGTACILMVAGFSVLLGLSVHSAWVSLMISIVCWAFILHWVKWHRRTAGHEAGVKERKQLFKEYAGCLSVLIIVTVGSWIVGRPLFPLGRHGASKLDPSLQAIADRTEAYWEVAVAQLHQARFGLPPIAGETSGAFRQRQLQLMTSGLSRVNNASTELVDPELVAMVQGHCTVDKTELQLVERVNAANRGQRFVPPHVLAEQEVSKSMEFWASLTEKQIGELPPELQLLVVEVLELEGTRLEQLREIELMQVRLQERYKGRKFLLPEVYEGT